MDCQVDEYEGRRGSNIAHQAFTLAWKSTCESTGDVSLLIPKGTYSIGPIQFLGPCKSLNSLTIQMQASFNSHIQPCNILIRIKWMISSNSGLTNLLGICRNVKFASITKTRLRGITSMNSKFFHIVLLDCKDFHGTGIEISAPANSPNTYGIHIERSTSVLILNSVIGTGDDFISIGQGNSHVTINLILIARQAAQETSHSPNYQASSSTEYGVGSGVSADVEQVHAGVSTEVSNQHEDMEYKSCNSDRYKDGTCSGLI
ncbi:hypothetical protein IFM89_027327 [Coptis chinensis]|uniref:Polygalacturonase n=1 Tax=Coptis chinensis TaxID=261450 RepID=A0A835M1Y4_9MAGN|nr:hypothetical protein IFM89_027327 [Coptis chinensis]